MNTRLSNLAVMTALSFVLAASARAQVAVTPAELEGVDVVEQLDKPLPKDAVFRDHEGKTVRLGDYFDGKKPVVLTLAYANCKVVCSMVLGAEADVLKQQEWRLGKEYRALTISIDPNDTPAIAAKKRRQMLALYGADDKGQGEPSQWDFLVGDPQNVARVAEAVGFKYKYDARQEQYAHPAVLMITKPTGELARYLYGLSFEPQDVRLGLLEASQGRSISTIEKMILFCYMYDPIGAKYVLVAKNVMRVAGGITMIVLGAFLAFFWRRELRKKRLLAAEEAAATSEHASVDTKGTARARA
jgi:protein SCO1/2